jgi:deoxyguanosine kinase
MQSLFIKFPDQPLRSSGMKNSYLVIEGNIGSGKTSLAKIIAAKYNRKLVLEEFADNTFLPQFYKNPERFAFPLELSFLAERYGQLRNLLNEATKSGQPIVSDYLFEKSLIFAGINLDKDEWELYQKFYHIIRETLPKPDLVIYLHKSIPHLKKNISMRGRVYENEISDDYLARLEEGYHKFFREITQPEIKIIDTDEIDFINHPGHLEKLLAQIFKGA